jgi:hypothetical protein
MLLQSERIVREASHLRAPIYRSRSIHLECLEPRQVLSTVAGAPALVNLLQMENASPLIGTGSGMITSRIQQRDGSILMTASVHGQAKPLGLFTGQFRIMVPSTGRPISVGAYLKNLNRRPMQLMIALETTPPGSRQIYQGPFTSPTAPGVGLFVVWVLPNGQSFDFDFKDAPTPR